jgi:hypothetical protein
MKIAWDVLHNDLVVVHDDGREESLRDYYIATRVRRGVSVGALQVAMGVSHPRLYQVEKSRPGEKPSYSAKTIIAALATMGFEVRLIEPKAGDA